MPLEVAPTAALEVLFLTTQDPDDIVAEWPYYQNWTLPKAIEERGASVSIKCWQNPSLNTEALAAFDIISFLWCNNYHAHAAAFIAFVQDVLAPARKLSPSLRIINDTGIILWNADKEIYLSDLSTSGFVTPETIFVHDVHLKDMSELKAEIALFSNKNTPVVLKPSISGSSKQTHLIREPASLSTADMNFLSSVVRRGVEGSLLIQKYESGIENGEYSMVFIDGRHTHTMVKTPCKGEFRCQAEFGGDIDEIEAQSVPQEALKVARAIVNHLERKFPCTSVSVEEQAAGARARMARLDAKKDPEISVPEISSHQKDGAVYVRIDGVVRDDGTFVLMEVEAIEPHLWLETSKAPGCADALHKALLGESN